ncbi:hypothetical protein Ssi02_20790 [Sinosporangium siamense]|uniref:Uncharacterized protein n=1 Tax=Sinosporangium siamense TaxID=1367973 RepID=A0A919V5U5_9ACTN|nr:hypothetical protein Ssi02_20790 [Sinosporangium siamense]
MLIAMPFLVGVGWEQILSEFARLSLLEWGVLTALWLSSLWAYSYVLVGSLPGLTPLRGVVVSGVGSAVSNLLPFGGAAVGVPVTFAMARIWGHDNRSITTFVLVSGIWNNLSRLLLPVAGIVCLLATGRVVSDGFATAASTAGLTLAGAAALLIAGLWREGAARALGKCAAVVVKVVPERRRPSRDKVVASFVGLRLSILDVVRRGWLTMTAGMLGFLALQAALFHACLWATGVEVGFAETIAAFALGRLLSTVTITPSGSGVSEAGTVLLMTATFGTAPAATSAAVLLFWFFTYLIEIPFGGVVFTVWTWSRRRRGESTSLALHEKALEPAVPDTPRPQDAARS